MLLTANIYPPFHDFSARLIVSVDFHTLLMRMMLGFLLFAGGFHLNAQQLAQQKWPILVLATAGTIMSTVLVGSAFYLLFVLFAIKIPLIICMLFGSLISPTDPITVLAILKRAGIPESLELKIAGESLVNDGVAVVLFTSIMDVPVLSLRRWLPFERHAIALLTWGGLRGGLSVAMALSLPAAMYRDAFVSITYVILVFSIIVQGLTIGKLAKVASPPGYSER